MDNIPGKSGKVSINFKELQQAMQTIEDGYKNKMNANTFWIMSDANVKMVEKLVQKKLAQKKKQRKGRQ